MASASVEEVVTENYVIKLNKDEASGLFSLLYGAVTPEAEVKLNVKSLRMELGRLDVGRSHKFDVLIYTTDIHPL